MRSYFAESEWEIGDVIREDESGKPIHTRRTASQTFDGEGCGIVIHKSTVKEMRKEIEEMRKEIVGSELNALRWSDVKALFDDGSVEIGVIFWLDFLPDDTMLTYQETTA